MFILICESVTQRFFVKSIEKSILVDQIYSNNLNRLLIDTNLTE